MSRWLLAGLLGLAGLLALTPPGLCPCWAMLNIRAHHPHLGIDPNRPHAHDYLLEVFQAEQVTRPPAPVLGVADVLERLAHLGGQWRIPTAGHPPAATWQVAPLSPPPRAESAVFTSFFHQR